MTGDWSAPEVGEAMTSIDHAHAWRLAAPCSVVRILAPFFARPIFARPISSCAMLQFHNIQLQNNCGPEVECVQATITRMLSGCQRCAHCSDAPVPTPVFVQMHGVNNMVQLVAHSGQKMAGDRATLELVETTITRTLCGCQHRARCSDAPVFTPLSLDIHFVKIVVQFVLHPGSKLGIWRPWRLMKQPPVNKITWHPDWLATPCSRPSQHLRLEALEVIQVHRNRNLPVAGGLT